jgi:spermidine synthase
MALYLHDGDYSISCDGQELMHSKGSYSEYRMGLLCEGVAAASGSARILVGGLGLGYTLRGVLDVAGPEWQVVVAELVAEVIAWNRELLQGLHGCLLQDTRVKVEAVDVTALIKTAAMAGGYDAILLDVDNGPVAMVTASNRAIYSVAGIRSIHQALRPGGRAVFWSAGPDVSFEARLRNHGFSVTVVAEKRHAGAKRASVTLFIADKR